MIPEEVKPKFVKGAKRYGRKSRPDRPNSELTADSEETAPFCTDPSETTGVRRAKLRRSTSLESVEVTDRLHPLESFEKMPVEGWLEFMIAARHRVLKEANNRVHCSWMDYSRHWH